ncbi:hypothetical protein Tco_0709361 [Tanacetum coccineum]
MEDRRDKVRLNIHVGIKPERPILNSGIRLRSYYGFLCIVHATIANEDLKRFKLRSVRTMKDVRYIPDLKRRLISVGQLDKEGYHVVWGRQKKFFHSQRRQGKMQSIGVAERLSQICIAESMGIRTEAPNILWANLVKVVCGEAMKCTFIGSGSDEVRYSFRDTKSHQVIRSRYITYVDSIYGARSATNSSSLTKPIQKSQVVLVDIPENLVENDSIVAEQGLSSEITQSLGGSLDTSEGPKNSGSFEDSRRSDEEYSEDGASSK